MTLIDQTFRNQVGKKLTNRLGLALEQGEIAVEDLEGAIDMILPIADTMQTKEELFAFLDKLAQAWPFLSDIIELEEKQDSTISSIEDKFSQRNVQMVGIGKP